MSLKKYFYLIFAFLFLIMFPSKVDAINLNYCNYSEDVNLVLPVTIGAKISAIDRFYPFDSTKNLYYETTLFVHDEATCNSAISLPNINENDYFITYEYYYLYNDTITYVNYLGDGEFQYKDLTPPTINSITNKIHTNVEKYTELDDISIYITAFDETDGNIIPEIVYDNYSNNYDKIGEYTIVFEACDYSNNCSKYNQKILVEDITPPTIEGINYIKSYMSNPLKLEMISTMIKAFDSYDGDLSSSILIDSFEYNISIPGMYYAYYTVSDLSGNKIITPFKVDIEVIDDIAPIIEGPTQFTSKLSNMISVNNILLNIIVSDNSDEMAYKNLYIIDDSYTVSQYKIGDYKLIIGAYDKYGNESSPYIITITVVDDVAPTIDGKNEFESYLSSPISLFTIKSNLIVQDNHDENLFDKLEILDDNYSNNKDKIGIYNVSFIVKDISGNISNMFIVKITNIDNIIPTIEGTNYYKTLTTEKIDTLSIKLSLSAMDNIDGDLSSEIVLNDDSYSDNFSIPGTYFLTFYVSDSSNNISNLFKVKILVNENLDFLDYINNSFIYFDTLNYKTDSQIIELLGLNTLEYNSISTLENTYANNYNTVGEYIISFQIENTDYTKELIKINIITYTEETTQKNTSTSYKKEKKETIFQKIISFIKNIFNKILSFFKNLFR